APAISMDLFATFAAVARAKAPRNVDGKDLTDVLSGNSKSVHDIIFWQFSNQKAARQGRMKLLREAKRPDRLYDVVSDPGETKDLAAENPDLVKTLGAALDQWSAGLKGPAY
ncbi:MAG TPA: sulfatase, partial [Armatimonadota bacterium]|nr:sulfatase [Armatimonadota bacterium]